MEDNEKLLKIVKSRIYHGEMTREQFIDVINESEFDRLKDTQAMCEHNPIYKTSSNGYGYNECSKCGKMI